MVNFNLKLLAQHLAHYLLRLELWAHDLCLSFLAARLGFEPRYSDSESEVLPLDDLAIVAVLSFYRVFNIFQPGIKNEGFSVMKIPHAFS